MNSIPSKQSIRRPNTVTDAMPDLRDPYYSIEGCQRLLSLAGLGPFGRRLGGGRGADGGISQWIGEVFVDDWRKFGCAHEIVVAVAGNDREPRLRELGVQPAGLLHAAAED